MSKHISVNDDGDLEDNTHIPAPPDALIQKIQLYILDSYDPVLRAEDADTRMTTLEIWQAIQRLYPCESYTLEMLANWMHEKGFSFFDAGNMRFEWLLRTI
jgi:hypothetical protein